MPFAAIWMDLEIIILSERQKSYGITYIWNLKYDTNELIYKSEIDSQTQKTNLWVPKGKVWGWGINREFGIKRYTLLYIKWIINKDLLYSTGNYIQCLIVTYNGKESEKECVCVCV